MLDIVSRFSMIMMKFGIVFFRYNEWLQTIEPNQLTVVKKWLLIAISIELFYS